MRCKVRLLKFGTKASDGSVISEPVVRAYIESPEAIEDLKSHRMIGSLTHRVRNIGAVGYSPETTNNLRKSVAKDDAILLIDNSCSPTHVLDKLWIEDGALWAEAQIFDEDGFDDATIQNIRRLKSILKYSRIGISMVVVGMWNSMKGGVDYLEKLVKLKGFDFTTTPSFPGSYVTNVMDDEGNEIEIIGEEKTFSNKEEFKFDGYRVKMFSDLDKLGINAPKTSKINNQFTVLKAKVYSTIEDINICDDQRPVEQKEFSQAQVMERVRLNKLSPRIRFRRLILDYRQALKAQGGIEKIAPDTLKIMRSLFSVDLLGILQELTPSILAGKNLNALLGSSALSVEVRKASQNMQLPLRMALQENQKNGFVSKARYQKIQAAYNDFIKSILEYVFSTPVNQKLKEEEEELGNGKEN